jgi:hypothetical protein
MEEILDLNGIKDYMIGYYMVNKIYEIRDYFYFAEEKIEYNSLVMNLKVLDYITEINFVFSKDVPILDQIKEITKVGNLMNFEVYLDPMHDNSISMFANGENKIDIKINFS